MADAPTNLPPMNEAQLAISLALLQAIMSDDRETFAMLIAGQSDTEREQSIALFRRFHDFISGYLKELDTQN